MSFIAFLGTKIIVNLEMKIAYICDYQFCFYAATLYLWVQSKKTAIYRVKRDSIV
jgi:hypothetical protein